MGVSSVAFAAEDNYADAYKIVLNSVKNADGSYTHSVEYDGNSVTEYDYTWNVDPSTVHTDVKNSPAEYYTGTKPGDDAVYIAHDIYYYPELDSSSFKRMNYDGEQEWCYYYTAEGYTSYIFSTLPVSGNSVPTSMMYSAEEAYTNAVLHITQPGDYIIEGEWHGQIWVDLENYCDDPFTDPTAKVNLILNGVNIDCTVAAGIVFNNVYECDNTWEDQTSWSYNVDTTDAGAIVTIADDTINYVSGTNIFRILKTQYKSGSTSVQKKRLKIDGAFYSYQSMNIEGGEKGTGVLEITAGFEGLGSELHLSINGGNVYINSQDDGINVNEDGVSVLTINGGNLHILAGLGNEGDGIDSNGYLVVNGGTTISMANPGADSGMDSDFGTYVFGGNVVALGSTMDWVETDNTVVYDQATMNLQFSSSKSAGDAIVITDTQGNGIFAYDPDKDEVTGTRTRTYTGAIISCEDFEIGESYYVYIGGDITGTETMGVYDMTMVTAVSNTSQQSYGSTGTQGGPGSRPQRPGSSQGGTTGTGNTTFALAANVTKFSSVANYSTTSITVTPQPTESTTPTESSKDTTAPTSSETVNPDTSASSDTTPSETNNTDDTNASDDTQATSVTTNTDRPEPPNPDDSRPPMPDESQPINTDATDPSDTANTEDTSSSDNTEPTSETNNTDNTDPSESVAPTTPDSTENTENTENTDNTEDTTPTETTTVETVTSVGEGGAIEAVEEFILSLENDKDPKGSSFNILAAKTAKIKKKSIQVKWNNIGAAKYIVYGNKCGNDYKKIKEVTKTSFTQKKLKKGTYYKYLIVAVDENDTVIATSKTIHTATKGGKFCNFKKVNTATSKKVTLSKGDTVALKAKAVAETKKLKCKEHRKVKYESTNTKVAKVTKKGVIKAKKKGTCYVYAYAQNGICKKIKITVK